MDRRLTPARLLTVAAAVAVVLGGCRSGSVSLDVGPEVGAQHRYRYEIVATVTQTIDGEEPLVTDIVTELVIDEEILARTADGARAELTLRRDGGAPRTVEVRLSRSGSLEGIDLIEGRSADTFGLDSLSALLGGAPLPAHALAPGDRWAIDDDTVTGEGRLLRLGIVDGRDVAVVRSTLAHPLTEVVETGTTTAELDGELRSTARTTYDLADGTLRRGHTQARGEVQVSISPPSGVDADPVLGVIAYDVDVRVTRLS